MTAMMPESEFQPRRWEPAPRGARGTEAWLDLAAGKLPGGTRPGLVQIKPHANLAKARAQMQTTNVWNDQTNPKHTRPADFPKAHTQWLVTYVPLHADGRIATTRQAQKVQLWAQQFRFGKPTNDYYDVGVVMLPPHIAFPRVDQPGFFGMAVEDTIRKHIATLVARRGRKLDSRGGGAGAYPDVLWQELAAMYHELAQELRDPFYAEMASELGRLTYEAVLAA